jgi:hypothetical protein
MAIQSPARTSWQRDDHPDELPEEGDRAERLASWLVVYLAAFLTSLAVGGGAWAMGLLR